MKDILLLSLIASLCVSETWCLDVITSTSCDLIDLLDNRAERSFLWKWLKVSNECTEILENDINITSRQLRTMNSEHVTQQTHELLTTFDILLGRFKPLNTPNIQHNRCYSSVANSYLLKKQQNLPIIGVTVNGAIECKLNALTNMKLNHVTKQKLPDFEHLFKQPYRKQLEKLLPRKINAYMQSVTRDCNSSVNSDLCYMTKYKSELQKQLRSYIPGSNEMNLDQKQLPLYHEYTIRDLINPQRYLNNETPRNIKDDQSWILFKNPWSESSDKSVMQLIAPGCRERFDQVYGNITDPALFLFRLVQFYKGELPMSNCIINDNGNSKVADTVPFLGIPISDWVSRQSRHFNSWYDPITNTKGQHSVTHYKRLRELILSGNLADQLYRYGTPEMIDDYNKIHSKDTTVHLAHLPAYIMAVFGLTRDLFRTEYTAWKHGDVFNNILWHEDIKKDNHVYIQNTFSSVSTEDLVTIKKNIMRDPHEIINENQISNTEYNSYLADLETYAASSNDALLKHHRNKRATQFDEYLYLSTPDESLEEYRDILNTDGPHYVIHDENTERLLEPHNVIFLPNQVVTQEELDLILASIQNAEIHILQKRDNNNEHHADQKRFPDPSPRRFRRDTNTEHHVAHKLRRHHHTENQPAPNLQLNAILNPKQYLRDIFTPQRKMTPEEQRLYNATINFIGDQVQLLRDGSIDLLKQVMNIYPIEDIFNNQNEKQARVYRVEYVEEEPDEDSIEEDPNHPIDELPAFRQTATWGQRPVPIGKDTVETVSIPPIPKSIDAAYKEIDEQDHRESIETKSDNGDDSNTEEEQYEIPVAVVFQGPEDITSVKQTGPGHVVHQEGNSDSQVEPDDVQEVARALIDIEQPSRQIRVEPSEILIDEKDHVEPLEERDRRNDLSSVDTQQNLGEVADLDRQEEVISVRRLGDHVKPKTRTHRRKQVAKSYLIYVPINNSPISVKKLKELDTSLELIDMNDNDEGKRRKAHYLNRYEYQHHQSSGVARRRKREATPMKPQEELIDISNLPNITAEEMEQLPRMFMPTKKPIQFVNRGNRLFIDPNPSTSSGVSDDDLNDTKQEQNNDTLVDDDDINTLLQDMQQMEDDMLSLDKIIQPKHHISLKQELFHKLYQNHQENPDYVYTTENQGGSFLGLVAQILYREHLTPPTRVNTIDHPLYLPILLNIGKCANIVNQNTFLDDSNMATQIRLLQQMIIEKHPCTTESTLVPLLGITWAKYADQTDVYTYRRTSVYPDWSQLLPQTVTGHYIPSNLVKILPDTNDEHKDNEDKDTINELDKQLYDILNGGYNGREGDFYNMQAKHQLAIQHVLEYIRSNHQHTNYSLTLGPEFGSLSGFRISDLLDMYYRNNLADQDLLNDQGMFDSKYACRNLHLLTRLENRSSNWDETLEQILNDHPLTVYPLIGHSRRELSPCYHKLSINQKEPIKENIDSFKMSLTPSLHEKILPFTQGLLDHLTYQEQIQAINADARYRHGEANTLCDFLMQLQHIPRIYSLYIPHSLDDMRYSDYLSLVCYTH